MANSKVFLFLATKINRWCVSWDKAFKPWGYVTQTLIDYLVPRKE